MMSFKKIAISIGAAVILIMAIAFGPAKVSAQTTAQSADAQTAAQGADVSQAPTDVSQTPVTQAAVLNGRGFFGDRGIFGNRTGLGDLITLDALFGNNNGLFGGGGIFGGGSNLGDLFVLDSLFNGNGFGNNWW